ncbi:transketolase [Paenibacillus sp. FSL H8-0261]|uniref:transketolase n=1 Tax=Paenibacillus sp. FSL H8-0261 TaxID=2921381 RepID=UPI00324C0CB4
MNSKGLAWKIRRHSIEMTHLSHGSHIGSILSVADIIAVLYSGVANVNPEDPNMPDRDKIILSKGHAGAAIYAALAEVGFFSVEELKTHYADGSRLSGHVSHKGVPGVEFSTGSLGHGLSVGAGMAYGAKKDSIRNNVFVICGDGECDEGSMWEAALVANHFKLNNLIAIIDHNKMQSLDFCENTISLSPFVDKWKSFGWNVIDIDGHDHNELKEALLKAKLSEEKPTVIIANTIKGNGISFMENEILWHYRFPHEGEEYDTAVAELKEQKPEDVEDMYIVEVPRA